MKRTAWIIVLAFSMAGIYAWADSDDEYTRIARISYMEGNVSFQGATDVDWTAASINFPLQPGDRIYTGTGGRAEIEFDEGSVIRLAESTDIQVLSMRENLIQIRILTGLSSLVVSSGLEFEIDTPAAAFIVLQSGTYRFETEENGDTYATVRTGELETVSHRFVQRVHTGTQIFVTAGENGFYDLRSARGRDAWDEWNDRRNADRIVRDSRRYVSGEVYVGLNDLDRHGRWVTIETYGAAWVPLSVGVSWSPYSIGRWCYRSGWGWTWVSYEPWGWLPYHYGRWYNHARFGWCWLPGPSFSFSFWSPGLVTFYYGPSWVSWCPLGPGDYYSINNYCYNKRLYSHYITDLRRLHFRSPGDCFNRHVRGAFRTMEIKDFRGGRSGGIATNRGYRKLDQPWKKGSVVRERLAIKPTTRSSSPAPDQRAERSKIQNPRPAVVFSKPTARAKNNNEYVPVKNAEIVSRVTRRTGTVDKETVRTGRALSSTPRSSSGSTQNRTGSTSQKRYEKPESGTQREPRADPPDGRGSGTDRRGSVQTTEAKRAEPAAGGRNAGAGATGSENLRSRPQISSRQYLDRSSSPQSTTERSPIVNTPGRRSGGSDVSSSLAPSQSSSSRARSTRQNSGSRQSGSYTTRSSSPRSSSPSTSGSSTITRGNSSSSPRSSGSSSIARGNSSSSTSARSAARTASGPSSSSAGKSSSSASSSSGRSGSGASRSSESRGAVKRGR